MFGIILTVLAALAIAFAAYRLGGSSCMQESDEKDARYNTSIVVIVLGVMFLLCGMLSMISGGGLPFNFVLGQGSSAPSPSNILA